MPQISRRSLLIRKLAYLRPKHEYNLRKKTKFTRFKSIQLTNLNSVQTLKRRIRKLQLNIYGKNTEISKLQKLLTSEKNKNHKLESKNENLLRDIEFLTDEKIDSTSKYFKKFCMMR